MTLSIHTGDYRSGRGNESQSSGVALFNPPHRRLTHYFDNRSNGRLKRCDDLYATIDDADLSIYRIERMLNAPNTVLGQIFSLGFFTALWHGESTDDLSRSLASEKDRRKTASEHYNRECRDKPAVVGTSVMRQAVDMAVRGAEFLYDHPGYVVAAAGVGAVLVFAPEAAPLLLAL